MANPEASVASDPSMSRLQFVHRVRGVWAWLPAFRAVAETEHLPTAARELGLVPSSLSRSIKLLEEAIGVPLFDHGGKTLVLNGAGRVLLEAVRGAMRTVDDAVRAAAGDEMSGTVTIAIAAGLSSAVLVAAVGALEASYPELCVATVAPADGEIDGMLLRGEIDVAVVSRAYRDPELAVCELARAPRGIYARDADAAMARVPLRCVVVGGRTEVVDDGWPVDVARKVMVRACDDRMALEVCAAGPFVVLAVEDSVARSGLPLARLPIADVAPQIWYAVSRRPLGVHPRTNAVIAALRTGTASA